MTCRQKSLSGMVMLAMSAAAAAQTTRPAAADPVIVDPADVAQTARLQPLAYNHPGLVVDLGVGLWASPVPTGNDGLDELLVICNGKPKGGVYRFDRLGGPNGNGTVFKPGQRLGPAKNNSVAGSVGGRCVVLRPGEAYLDFRATQFRSPAKLPATTDDLLSTADHRIRQNAWRYVDFDGDGIADLAIGLEDWKDYGWDDAYDAKGAWKNGPLRGWVYVLRNAGTDETPRYEKPFRLEAGGKAIETFGMPTPCFADYDGDGDLDLICGNFVGELTYFENAGTRSVPKYAAGRPLTTADGTPIRIDAPMIVPVPFDVDGDGDPDLLVGGEDGRVFAVENTGRPGGAGPPAFRPPTALKQQADELKFGVLCTPVPFDFDGDGDLDLVCGNGAGEIGWFENLSGPGVDAPKVKWAAPRLLAAGGVPIHVTAGPNGSVQGPAEQRWGYTTFSVADWDGDGRPDVVANGIWGKVVWYRNVGTRTAPVLAAAVPIQVTWPADRQSPYKPDWVWWTPEGRDLVTQWRTTPWVGDVNGDGLADLVMLDRDGYLSLFERHRAADGGLELLPPRHAFRTVPGGSAAADDQPRPVRKAAEGPGSAPQGPADFVRPGPDGKLLFRSSQPVVGRGQTDVKAADRAGDPAYRESDPPAAADEPLRLSNGWAGRSGRRKFCLVDIDRDGDLDLLVNGQNVSLLRNVSQRPGEFLFKPEGPLDTAVLAGHDTSPSAGDFDGDGVADIIVGAEDGFIYFMKNPVLPAKRPR